MPVSIDDLYKQAAAKNEWRKALVCTDMLFVEDGDFVICTPPHEDVSYQSYQQNLNNLLKYPNDAPITKR